MRLFSFCFLNSHRQLIGTLRSDQNRKTLAQFQLHAALASGVISPSFAAKAQTPAAILKDWAVIACRHAANFCEENMTAPHRPEMHLDSSPVDDGCKPHVVKQPESYSWNQEGNNRHQHQQSIAHRMVAPRRSPNDLLPYAEAKGVCCKRRRHKKHCQPRPPQALLFLEKHTRICKVIHIIANCN